MLFSQRKGIRPVQKALQLKCVDDELRARLWSMLQICLWDKWRSLHPYGGVGKSDATKQIDILLRFYWIDYFKVPLDTLPEFRSDYDYAPSAYKILRKHFFEAKWWGVFDFIEFTIKKLPTYGRDPLKKSLNQILEEENSAYRIVGSEVVEISDPTEIESVEVAIASPLRSVRKHIETALEKLADKKKPDYRNSIKESISAVEALSRSITGMPGATLGDCLKEIQGEGGPLHPAFVQSLKNLYGYTSDQEGIRHALIDGKTALSYSDAKFMIVVCSGFVNYITAKCSELNINLKEI